MYKENPKMKGSGMLGCIPQSGPCPVNCEWCFFNERSFLDIEKETPNVLSAAEAEGRVIRVNDGNDSSNQFALVLEATKGFKDKFYNTSLVALLHDFPGPVVLTVNPRDMTDKEFNKVEGKSLDKIMYVRFRANTWNRELLQECISYYNVFGIPTVITPMAYPSLMPIPQNHMHYYDWGLRTINNYWKITRVGMEFIVKDLQGHFYICEGECRKCGNCLREYYRKKEELRNA